MRVAPGGASPASTLPVGIGGSTGTLRQATSRTGTTARRSPARRVVIARLRGRCPARRARAGLPGVDDLPFRRVDDGDAVGAADRHVRARRGRSTAIPIGNASRRASIRGRPRPAASATVATGAGWASNTDSVAAVALLTSAWRPSRGERRGSGNLRWRAWPAPRACRIVHGDGVSARFVTHRAIGRDPSFGALAGRALAGDAARPGPRAPRCRRRSCSVRHRAIARARPCGEPVADIDRLHLACVRSTVGSAWPIDGDHHVAIGRKRTPCGRRCSPRSIDRSAVPAATSTRVSEWPGSHGRSRSPPRRGHRRPAISCGPVPLASSPCGGRRRATGARRCRRPCCRRGGRPGRGRGWPRTRRMAARAAGWRMGVGPGAVDGSVLSWRRSWRVGWAAGGCRRWRR